MSGPPPPQRMLWVESYFALFSQQMGRSQNVIDSLFHKERLTGYRDAITTYLIIMKYFLGPLTREETSKRIYFAPE